MQGKKPKKVSRENTVSRMKRATEPAKTNVICPKCKTWIEASVEPIMRGSMAVDATGKVIALNYWRCPNCRVIFPHPGIAQADARLAIAEHIDHLIDALGWWRPEMKAKAAIEEELRKVRELLKQLRDENCDDDMLYGAQQALGWALGEAQSPSRLEKIIQNITLHGLE
jgi:hypothetical protein